MTLDELAKHGLRVKRIVWDQNDQDNHANAISAYQISHAARICAALEPIAPPDPAIVKQTQPMGVAQAARVLLAAAQAVDLGRSIFNDRWNEGQPSQQIEGPIWDDLREAITNLRTLLPEGGSE